MRNYVVTTSNSVLNVQEVVRIERSMGMMEFYVNYGDGALPILIIPEQEVISVEAPQNPQTLQAMPGTGTFGQTRIDNTGAQGGIRVRPMINSNQNNQPF